MDAVLGASLALPLVAAVAAVLLPRRSWVVPATTGLAAAGWVAIAAVDRPPTIGRIVAGPVIAATVAGAALLATARPPGSVVGRSGAACAITVLAVAASTGDGDVPDRPLAVGLVVLALLAAVRVRAAGESLPSTLVASVPGAAAGGALLLSDPRQSAVLVVLAAAGAVAAVAVTGDAGALLPAVVLAVARIAGPAHGPIGRSDRLVWAAVAGAGAVAVVVAGREVIRRRAEEPSESAVDRPAVDLPACAVVVAALVLVAQDLDPVRSAGLLLAAGGVLALVSRHPAGLLAAVPGVAAALAAAPSGTEPVHAAAGAAAVLVVLVALLVPPLPRAAPTGWLAPALAFAALPLWGWSGATPDAYADTLAVAAAVVAVVVGAVLAGSGTPGAVPTVRSRSLGRLRRRPTAADHARTHPTEEVQPTEVAAQASQGVDAAVGPPQRAVALPPRAVPGRAGPGGVGGRGRLRARPGRPPGP